MAYIHVYTGNGKGKTTAALGLTLRTLGAGGRVYIGQFAKKGLTSEHHALAAFGARVRIEQFGTGRFVHGEPSPEDLAAAADGIARAAAVFAQGDVELVVLDEINVAVDWKLVAVDTVLGLMNFLPADTELVLTGRGADPAVIARADLVTEMRAVKHYFQAGVKARVGIEK